MKHDPPALPQLLTEEELIVELAGKIRRHGEQGKVAAELGLSQGCVSNLLTKGRGIGDQVASALGYRRVVLFERVD